MEVPLPRDGSIVGTKRRPAPRLTPPLGTIIRRRFLLVRSSPRRDFSGRTVKLFELVSFP
jgi:hypothetical protein